MDEDATRWDRRWSRMEEGTSSPPEPWIAANAGLLPPGPLLDVASGRGRHALFLAAQGRRVTALDVSAVALARLRERAHARGLEVATVRRDLDAPGALAGLGPFTGMVVVRYKPGAAQWRRLLEVLAPGGVVLLLGFGRGRAEQGFRADFCLDEAELRDAMRGRLECLRYERPGPAGAHLEASVWRRPVAT